ncbi:solute carrier family 35 member G2a isoform X2 [Gadus macrocephalus]|nr:solute carrier family 35 member G2a isoform X2 [Gadus macrocephalus]XP_059908603.1 solute carrier family 35 member G2a isoform X2 [Gadus macrocephalus]
MESAHLLGPGAKKRVKIHPHTVTAQYATRAPYSPQPGVHTHSPQPGDEGYDDAPSFEDFGSFLDETSDRTKLTEARKWPQTLFGSRDKEKEKGTPLRALQGAGGGGGAGGVLGGGGAGEGSSSSVGVKGPGKGVGGQLASFGEASVSASRWTWALLLGAALAHGALVFLTRLASERFGLSPLLLVLVCSAAQLLSVAAPLQRGENPFGPPGYRLRLLCYGLTYSLSLCCASASLAFAATEYATPTGRLATSALSAALTFLLLEERLGLADGVALVTGVCGLGLTLLPAADQPEAPGGAALADPVAFWRAAFGWSLSAMAGLWMALALVSYRSLKERVGLATALFTVSWTGCLLAPASMVLLQGGWAWPSPSMPGGVPVWGLMAGLVAASVLGFLGTTHALTRLHPALVSASLSLEVPVAALLQLAVLPAVPFAPEVVGDVMVVLSVGWLVTVKLLPSHGAGGRKQREEYEEILDSPIK